MDPVSKTIYVRDYATTNVYAIDSISNTVISAVYTNGLYSTADIGHPEPPRHSAEGGSCHPGDESLDIHGTGRRRSVYRYDPRRIG